MVDRSPIKFNQIGYKEERSNQYKVIRRDNGFNYIYENVIKISIKFSLININDKIKYLRPI